MRILFTILAIFFSLATNAQFISAGYVTSAPIATIESACGSSTVSVQVYSRTGTTNAGDTLYTAADGSTFIADFSYYGWAATSGAVVTKTFQIWGDKVLRNVATCGSGGGGSTSAGLAPAPTAWGKKIKPKVLMDLSRFDQFNGGGGGMFALFDDSTNTKWHPWRQPAQYAKKGWDNFHRILWRGNRGLRMIFDLIGDTNINDLSKKYVFRDTVYAYDKTFNAGNGALYLASLDSVLANVAWYDRWKYFARPDSLLKPFAVIIPNNGAAQGGEWKKFKLRKQDSARYVYAWAVPDTTGGSAADYPDVGELSIYGTPNFDSASVKHWVDYPVPVQTNTLDQFTGVNMGGLYNTKALKDRYGLRLYSWPMYVFDKDSLTAFPSNTFDANPYNNVADWNIIDSLRELGTRPYFVVAGGNYRQNYLSGGGGDLNKMPPLDSHVAEVEDPASYQRSADFFRHFGAKFGRNTKGLTAGQLRWNGEQPTGLGNYWFDDVENGNEEEHRTGISELGYFMKSQMDFDGYAGRFPNLGLRSADDSMKLLMSATHAPDTNRVKLFVYLSHFLRPDSLFVWGSVNQHHYSTSYAKNFGYYPAIEALAGARGATAEYDSLKFRLKDIVRNSYRFIRKPYIDIELTEWGYDHYQQPTPDPAPFLHTFIQAPNYPSYDSTQDKAISIEAGIMESYAAGINNLVIFMSENPCFCPNNNAVLFATAGEIKEWTGYTATDFWATHHTQNWHSRMLKGWVWDSEIRGGALDSVSIYKLRKVDAPDSVCYYVRYSPLSDAGHNITLNVGSVTGNGTKKYLNFTDTPPTESAAVVTSGEVSVVAQARAQYYFFQETGIPTQPTINTQIRFSNRIKIRM
jgi:hypothetical protein